MHSAERAQGDAALARGDRAAAAAQYKLALEHGKLMDFEYYRIRSKYAQLSKATWSGNMDGLKATRSTLSPTAYAVNVMIARRDARQAKVTGDIAAAIEAELVDATRAEVLVAGAPRGDDLLGLYDKAKELSCQPAIPGILGALETWPVGLVARSQDGVVALRAALEFREGAHNRNLPVRIDAALDAELRKLASAQVPAVARADARFDDIVSLRERARVLAAPAEAIAYAERALDAPLAFMIADADALAAKHQYVAAYDQLAPSAVYVARGHAVHGKLASIASAGAAWHTEQASAATGFAQLVHLTAASSFDPNGTASKMRTSLLTAIATELRLRYSTAYDLEVEPACGDVKSVFGSGSTPPVRRARVYVKCGVSDRTWSEQRGQTYEAEEEWEETKIVEETTQVGGDNSCTVLSVRSGTCRATEVTTRTPVVTKHKREVKGTKTYALEHRDITVTASGAITIPADDGTTLSAPIAFEKTAKETAWSYELPPRKVGEPARPQVQAFPAGHTPAAFLDGARSAMSAATTHLGNLLAAHHAKLARAKGVTARDAGNAADAEKWFVASVMIGGAPTDEAAAWFKQRHELAPAQVASVLGSPGFRGPVEVRPAAVATAYAATPLETLTDSYNAADADAIKPPEDTDKRRIVFGRERMGAYIGLSSFSLKSATDRTPPSAMASLVLSGSPIEHGLPFHYGFAIHDELGGRFSIGSLTEHRSYSNGETEGLRAMALEGWARLMVGIRTHHVGVYAGASVGYLRATSGDTKASGSHAEPALRLKVRWTARRSAQLEVRGFAASFGDMERGDHVSVSIPCFAGHCRFGYDRVSLPTTTLDASGQMTLGLGAQRVHVFGFDLGGTY